MTLADRLLDAGMSPLAAQDKAGMFERALRALGPGAAGADVFAAFVPGRIEVLGKHTDYAGGRSLLCAVERGVCLLACPRDDRAVRVRDIACEASVETTLARGASPLPGWGTYVATAARRLSRNFPDAGRGADIAFASDLPMAAGLSSSSALLTAVVLALVAVNDLSRSERWIANIASREDLAEYLGTVENGRDFRGLDGDAGVGTFGGSEDHTAMLCCRAGELSEYSFGPVRHERQIPLPPRFVFVVAVSGVVAEKTGAAREAYNRASTAAGEVLARWNRATGRADASLRAAVESARDAAERIRALVGEHAGLRARFDQFVEETFVIIPQVADRLAAGDMVGIGDLVERSQAAAEHGLRNQVRETSFLARSARDLGAVAASAFGAGFGGSVWALVSSADAADFSARWSARYQSAFAHRAGQSHFFTTSAGPSAITSGGWIGQGG